MSQGKNIRNKYDRFQLLSNRVGVKVKIHHVQATKIPVLLKLGNRWADNRMVQLDHQRSGIDWLHYIAVADNRWLLSYRRRNIWCGWSIHK